MSRRNHIERDIQKQFIAWCWTPPAHRWPDAVILQKRKIKVGRSLIEVEAPTLAFWHPANGEARNAITGALLKAMGVRRGILDLWLPVPRGDRCGLVLELKAPGGRLSKDQNVWIDFLELSRWVVKVPTSVGECIRFTIQYLDEK